MIDINIAEFRDRRDIFEWALWKACEVPTSSNSITDGVGKFPAYLHDRVLAEFRPQFGFKLPDEDSYHWDLVKNGKKYEAKVKQRNVISRAHFFGSIAKFNQTQDCDYYIFSSVVMDYPVQPLIEERIKVAIKKKMKFVMAQHPNLSHRATSVVEQYKRYCKELVEIYMRYVGMIEVIGTITPDNFYNHPDLYHGVKGALDPTALNGWRFQETCKNLPYSKLIQIGPEPLKRDLSWEAVQKRKS